MILFQRDSTKQETGSNDYFKKQEKKAKATLKAKSYGKGLLKVLKVHTMQKYLLFNKITMKIFFKNFISEHLTAQRKS